MAIFKDGTRERIVGIGELGDGRTVDNVDISGIKLNSMPTAADGEISLNDQNVTNAGTIKLGEQANAEADTAAYGQLWVKTATPNELYFTTDAGDDIRITNGTNLAAPPSSGAVAADDITTGDAATTVQTSSGNVTIDSNAGSVLVDGHTGVTVTSSNSGEVDITSAANVDINATTGVAIDGTTVAVNGTDDSNLTVTGSGKDIDIAVAGGGTQELRLASAGTGSSALHLNASAGSIDIDSADNITVDAADEIVVTTTSADGHIALVSAHTAGVAFHIDANADAASEVQIDAGILDIDVTGAATIDGAAVSLGGSDDSSFAVTANSSSSKGLTLDARNTGSGAATITIGTTSGTAISIGAATSETTVNDNLTVTGDLTVNGTTTTINSTTLTVDDKVVVIASGAADSAAADGAGISVDGASATILYDHTGTQWEMNKPLEVAGDIATTGEVKTATLSYTDGDNAITIADGGAVTVAAGLTSTAATNSLGTTSVGGVLDITDTTEASDATGDTGALRCEGGASIAKKLFVGTDLDVDGTSNLDAVDIDGAVQIDNTVTVGVDDTGYDVKFFGATSGQFMLWDESADELVLAGDSKLSFHDAAGGENIIASSDGHLEVNAGATLDMTAPTVDVNASTTVEVDTAIFSVDGTDDSNITVTGSGKDIDIAVAGGGTQELRLASAGTGASALHLNASAGSVDIDSADAITIDAADEIVVTTTSADGHISLVSAHTSGVAFHIDANADAGSEVQIDAGILDVDVTAGITIDGTTVAVNGTDDSNLTVTGSAKDLDIAVAGGGTQELRLASAGTGASALHLNASAGSVDIDSADAITVDAADEIVVTTTSADGHIALVSAHTAGVAFHIDANADAASEVQIDAGILDIDVTGAATIDAASLDVTSDAVTFTSANADDPLLTIKNTTNDATGARLRLEKDRGSNNGTDGDDCGIIEFYATDDGSAQTEFARITAEVADASNSAEGGKISLSVASHDGEIQPGLVIEDGDAEDEVDVTVGNGAASVVSMPGILNVTNGIEVTTKGAIAGGSGSAGTALAPGSGSATTRAGVITITMQSGHTWSATGSNAMGVQFNNTAIDADSVIVVTSNLQNTPFAACNVQDNRCDFVASANQHGDIGPGSSFVLNYVIL